MSDSLIRIQCMKCRTDIIFITDNGRVKEEEGFIYREFANAQKTELRIHCEKCDTAVTFTI